MGGTSELVSELLGWLFVFLLIACSALLSWFVIYPLRAYWDRIFLRSDLEIAPDFEGPEADPDSDTDEELVIWIDDDQI